MPSQRILFLLLALQLFTAVATAQPANRAGLPQKPNTQVWRERGEREEESGEEIIARDLYFRTRRAGGADREIPADAYYQAAQQVQALNQQEQAERRKQGANSVFGTSNWTPVGPTSLNGVVTGRINSVASPVGQPSVLYIAAAGGGVWKSTNGGGNWSTTTDQLGSLIGSVVAVAPSDANVVYYGTGDPAGYFNGPYGAGMFKSTNAGASWSQAGNYFASHIADIAIHPTNSNIVWVVAAKDYVSAGNFGTGCWKTTDGGATWVAKNSGITDASDARSIVLDPTNSNVLYATFGYRFGTQSVYKSTNGGDSWFTINTGLPSARGMTRLAIAASSPQTLYASVAINTTAGTTTGLYQTTNGGASWTQKSGTTPNYLSQQGWYCNTIACSPTTPATVIVGGLDIYSSTANGASLTKRTNWTATPGASNYTHADIHYLGYLNGTLYAGTDGGIYKSTNNGTAWSPLNAGLPLTQFMGADYNPATQASFYGGLQDNGKVRTTNGGTLWTEVDGGDGGFTIVNQTTPSIVYSQYVQGSLDKSTNSGSSWSPINPNIGSDGAQFYSPYDLNQSSPSTLVFGSTRVWKSTNSGSTWAAIGTASQIGSSGGATTVAVAPSNSNVVYAGTDNGRIAVTTNNGSNWTATTGLGYVSDIAINPTNPAEAYAVFGGFSQAGFGTPHVRKTTTSGATWTDISNNLPNLPCNTVVIKTTAPTALFVGTDMGVYTSTNDGASWSAFNVSMPNVPVYDLKLNNSLGLLLAATYGRGCFTYQLSTGGTAATVTVTAPNGGESFTGGSSTTLAWSSTGTIANVKLEYSSNNGSAWTNIVASTGNTGSYSWSVPATATTQGLIRVSDAANSTVSDVSNAAFAITTGGGGNAEVEPNDATGTANALATFPATRTGFISSATDNDYFSLTASSGQSITLGLTVPSGLDYDLFLYNSAGAIVAKSEAGAGAAESITYSVTAAGTYYARAFGYNGAFSTTAGYTFTANVTGGGGGGTTNITETESNGTTGTANTLTSFPVNVTGFVGTSTDNDYFSLTATSGKSVVLSMTVPAGKDYDLFLYNSANAIVAKSEKGAGQAEAITYTPTATGTYYIRVFGYSGAFSTTVSYVLSVSKPNGGEVKSEELATKADNYELSQNYPNPFNPATTISYNLKQDGFVSLKVYDISGREVAILVGEEQKAGAYRVPFNASKLSSGVYFYRIVSGRFMETKRMVLVK